MRTTIEELRATLSERTVERDEACTERDEFRATARALKDDPDATRTERDAARTERDEARSGLDELKVAVGTLEDERDTARTERDTAQTERDRTVDELQTGCQLLADFVPMSTQIRRRMDAVTTQIREMEAARQATVVTVARLRGEMADRDRRMQAWYRNRGTVEARARFAARCATWTMIGAAMNAMNAAALEFDKAMGAIVGGREVPGLAKNTALEGFEEQEPLLAPGSPRLIFAHEQNAFRRMVDQDAFENLPNAVIVPSNDELVVVPFADGAGGTGGAGSAGG